ncbi:PfkB family carbohydrate kinase [Rathayibacter sp. VKM Ac-2630]|uniref:PfkB family carbohydrate kinase n=1 Tax=Rathayibacter sp. VKM Ac-2630 TaxID=1938617 RepID=UPI00098221D8|nr:PfkB family carbohydrate kinase [Rathayibacter sp. VKM Ac-2630]OOB90096.1 hypothetical protein B0T42_13745 [Rathayibacter sp. VKM Ac-2630]
MSGVLVLGQIARDLVLAVPRVPEGGGSATVRARREVLGGKGANQAVALAQLGAEVDLIGVAGRDAVGEALVARLRTDGIGVRYVARRGASALLVDVVDADGVSRLLEDVPEESLVRGADVAAVRELDRWDTVSLQLQQPAAAVLRLARRASAAGLRVVLDGAVQGGEADELLRLAEVLRADADEASELVGGTVRTASEAADAADLLRSRGPAIVAVASEDGNTIAWGRHRVHVPFGELVPVDRTGGGDSFVAGLVQGLRRGLGPEAAGRWATACSGSTVARLGGRPYLVETVAHAGT